MILLILFSQLEDFVSLSFTTISSSGPNGAIIHYRYFQLSVEQIEEFLLNTQVINLVYYLNIYRPSESTDRGLSCDEIYLCDSGAQFRYGVLCQKYFLEIACMSGKLTRTHFQGWHNRRDTHIPFWNTNGISKGIIALFFVAIMIYHDFYAKASVYSTIHLFTEMLYSSCQRSYRFS